MPDSRDFSGHGPSGWADAFAALPVEQPPKGGWTRVSRALDARTPRTHVAGRRERRTNWLIWTASAAVLVVVAWAPILRWSQETRGSSSGGPVATGTPPPAAIPAATASDQSTTQPQMTGRPQDTAVSNGIAGVPVSLPAESRTHIPGVDRERARDATDRLIASMPALARPAVTMQGAEADVTTATTTTQTANDPLLQLQAQSAQLEALIALARDDRVTSASSMVLTGELDARIAAIDAVLSQADIATEQSNELWRQRVEALRQLAGFESTERWLAAQGALQDAAFVSVD